MDALVGWLGAGATGLIDARSDAISSGVAAWLSSSPVGVGPPGVGEDAGVGLDGFVGVSGFTEDFTVAKRAAISSAVAVSARSTSESSVAFAGAGTAGDFAVGLTEAKSAAISSADAASLGSTSARGLAASEFSVLFATGVFVGETAFAAWLLGLTEAKSAEMSSAVAASLGSTSTTGLAVSIGLGLVSAGIVGEVVVFAAVAEGLTLAKSAAISSADAASVLSTSGIVGVGVFGGVGVFAGAAGALAFGLTVAKSAAMSSADAASLESGVGSLIAAFGSGCLSILLAAIGALAPLFDF